MSTETVEQVTEQPKGDAAFAAARAQIAQSEKDQAQSAVSDDTPETKTVEEPEKVADQPEESTEEEIDALLTPEEVAALPKKERSLYEKAQKNYTLKTQALAAERKEMEQWKTLIDALQNDPDSAIRQLAERRGLKFAEKPVEQDNTPIPDELKFLEPIFAAREKAIEAKLEAKYGPLKEQVDSITSQAIAAETESSLAQFEAKNPGWKKYETRMLEIGQEFMPAKPMSDMKYMETLLTLAKINDTEAEKTKKVVEKINKAVASAEPNISGVPTHRVETTPPSNWTGMTDRQQLEAAMAAAKRGERWVKP